MADVVRWRIANGPAPQLLAVVERHLIDGDHEVRDVVLASFLENFEADDPAYQAIRAAPGPTLPAALYVMESWNP